MRRDSRMKDIWTGDSVLAASSREIRGGRGNAKASATRSK